MEKIGNDVITLKAWQEAILLNASGRGKDKEVSGGQAE